MDNVINKLSRDSIDYDYSLDFKGLKIKDKADDGTEYHKTIYYMEHKAIIDDALLEIMDKENTYIINHNYIYRGSIKKLRKDILEQRNNITD